MQALRRLHGGFSARDPSCLHRRSSLHEARMKEMRMRKSLAVVAAALTMVAAASFVPQGAQATPLSPAAGLAVAADAAVIATPAYGACWRVWRCGPFGCGFR